MPSYALMRSLVDVLGKQQRRRAGHECLRCRWFRQSGTPLALPSPIHLQASDGSTRKKSGFGYFFDSVALQRAG
jgi:hypothetical protein